MLNVMILYYADLCTGEEMSELTYYMLTISNQFNCHSAYIVSFFGKDSEETRGKVIYFHLRVEVMWIVRGQAGFEAHGYRSL